MIIGSAQRGKTRIA